MKRGDPVEVQKTWGGGFRSWFGGYEFVRRCDIQKTCIIVKSLYGIFEGMEIRYLSDDVRPARQNLEGKEFP